MKPQEDKKESSKKVRKNTKRITFLVFLFSIVGLASPLALWLKLMDNQTWLVYFPWFLSFSLIGFLFIMRSFEKEDQEEKPYVVDENFKKLMDDICPLLKTIRSKSIAVYLASIENKFLLIVEHDKTDRLNQYLEKIKKEIKGVDLEFAMYTDEYSGNKQIPSFLNGDVYELKNDGKWIKFS